MTLKEFFAKARRRGKWRVKRKWDGERIVRCAKGLCPMAALGPRRDRLRQGPGDVVIDNEDAAKALGLRKRTVLKIADAADHETSKHRKWLLKNLGIRA